MRTPTPTPFAMKSAASRLVTFIGVLALGACAKGKGLGVGGAGGGGGASSTVASTVTSTHASTSASTSHSSATTTVATTGASTGSGLGCNDPCVVGPPESLSKCASASYGQCVTAVCAAIATCCSSAWDASCIAKTKTIGICGVENVNCP